MRAAILTTLQADTILTGLLPGGIFDGDAVGVISRATTPTAVDATTQELRPCGLLQVGADRRAGPLPTSSQLSVTIYLYERTGTAHIEPARLRLYTLLHRRRLPPAQGGAWTIEHGEDVLGQRDVALRASLVVCRYRVFIQKG